MKKKIDIELFTILFEEGLSADEIATFFDSTMSTVYQIKHNLKLEREVLCRDCNEIFTTSCWGKYRCDTCRQIVNEQYHLRLIFGKLCSSHPERAHEFEQEMINEEGEDFREFALNGFSFKNKKPTT